MLKKEYQTDTMTAACEPSSQALLPEIMDEVTRITGLFDDANGALDALLTRTFGPDKGKEVAGSASGSAPSCVADDIRRRLVTLRELAFEVRSRAYEANNRMA